MTMFIQISNDTPIGHAIVEDNLRMLFPNVNFPRIFNPSAVEPFGFAMYEFTQMPEVPRFKKLIEVPPVKRSDGIYYQTWGFEDMNEEEKEQSTEEKKRLVRIERDFIINKSDWTQLPDVILSEEKKIEWNTYRQALRDVSLQEGFPWDVVWPTPPL